MKRSRMVALALAAIMVLGAAGCGTNSGKTNGENANGKISISVGNWPDETKADALADKNRIRDEFMAKNPDIEIISDTYAFDTKTFMMKAAAKQLPTMFSTYFTEVSNIIKNGYAADITEQLKSAGMYDSMNPELLELVSSDGKAYGVPTDAYAQGLTINKKLFKDAGLVNPDGSIMVPKTYEEVAQFAQTIKEKTGKAGFVLPTTNNCGGWHFLNIAWAYGVEFEEQDENGKWKATFDTQEARDALQYIKDLKWKYNALLDDTMIDQEKMFQYFGTYQAAMMFSNPPGKFAEKYGTEISDVFVTSMPEGPKGRFSQMGGNLYMFVKDATPEQIDAGLKWLAYTGVSPELTDEQAESMKLTYKDQLNNGAIVLDKDAFNIWTNEDTIKKTQELRSEFTNVDPADYAEYYAFDGVTIKPEPAACAQELYSVLDSCVQEVLTNENANVDELISKAANDFQVNHLDKMD